MNLVIYQYLLLIPAFLGGSEVQAYPPNDSGDPVKVKLAIPSLKSYNTEPDPGVKALLDTWAKTHSYLDKYRNDNFPETHELTYFLANEDLPESAPYTIHIVFEKGYILISNQGCAHNGKYSGHNDQMSKDIAQYIEQQVNRK